MTGIAPKDWNAFVAKCELHGTLVRAAWQKTVDGIFETCAALAAARAEIGHGEWEHFVTVYLPFGSETARQLLAIHASESLKTLQNYPNHGWDLPASWRTLYELARLPGETLEALAEGGHVHGGMLRKDLKSALAVLASPDAAPQLRTRASGPEAGRYGAILADPPWSFDTWGEDGSGRGAENHYPVMSLAGLEALPVGDLAADDCALFMWTLPNKLMDAFCLMRAWGFELRTSAFVWVKEGNPGLGYWTRKRTETCFLAVRGAPRRLDAGVDEVIAAPRGRHSEKPAEQYERIERLVAGPYLELFARGVRPGWDSWGNQVGD